MKKDKIDIEKHILVMCSNMIVREDDMLLMIQRAPTKKILPNVLHTIGGKVHPGEDPLIAAQRELEEETGIHVDQIKLEAVITEEFSAANKSYDSNWLIFYFSGVYISGSKHPQPNREGSFLWVNEKQMLHFPLFPSLQEIAPLVLDPLQGTVFAKFVYDADTKIIEKIVNVTNTKKTL